MPDEGFLKRWSRRKAESREGHEPEPEPLAQAPADSLASAPAALWTQAGADLPVPARVPDAPEAGAADLEVPRLPTMDDVAALTHDSDFSGFVARGVDQAVRRSALKKLFADPHFNSMDRLDVYIDDYTQPSPVSDAMLASLRHAVRVVGRAVDAVEPADETPAPDPEAQLPTQPYPQQHPPETETR